MQITRSCIPGTATAPLDWRDNRHYASGCRSAINFQERWSVSKGEWLWVAVFILVVMAIANNITFVRSLVNPDKPMF